MPSSDTLKIKERLGIIDVIGSYIKLEKAGSNFKAVCPFHHEKTPSFFVSPVRNTFYCFGCGEKGDIFTFVERFEGLDFTGALQLLADRAGVHLSGFNKEEKHEQQKLYEVLQAAVLFFENTLQNAPEVHSYLKERGLKEKVRDVFRIGYVKNDWRSLFEHLRANGYTPAIMEQAGLIKTGGAHGHYDRFRGRIMFPITDSSGRVIAFSGRMFPHQDEVAKYINSPETKLFHKSRALFGIDKAKFGIKRLDFSVIVEGQFDVVMAHQAGYVNTVALSGTALSTEHIEQLGRLSKKIVFAFDADKAGVMSVGKSASRALRRGMDVKVASLPPGKDPADLVREGGGRLKEVIGGATHVIDYYLALIMRHEKDKRKQNVRVRELVLPFISLIPSKLDQAHFVRKVAQALDVTDEIIWDELKILPANVYEESTTSTAQVQKETPVQTDLSRKEIIERKLANIILWQEGLQQPEIDGAKLRKRLQAIIGQQQFETILHINDLSKEEQLFITEMGYANIKNLNEEVEILLVLLEEEHLKGQRNQLSRELREAEAQHNEAEIEKKSKAIQELSVKIETLKEVGTMS